MFTVFIIPASRENSNYAGTVKSFDGFDGNVQFVPAFSLRDVANLVKPPTHYMVIYDNEKVGKDLLEALPIFLEKDISHAFMIYKLVLDKGQPRVFKGVRIFQHWVDIQENCFLPACKNATVQIILNGWIKEHVF